MRSACMCLLFMFSLAMSEACVADGSGGGWSSGGKAQAATSDPDFRDGVAAVERKSWSEVIDHMGAVVRRDAKNADAWNYLGYAYRQLGDMDNSFKHYETALQINPTHRGAHEYMGEAYLQVGNLAQAEEHLKALDTICRLPCQEYSDLKARIAAYKTSHPSAAGG